MTALEGEDGAVADNLRYGYQIQRDATKNPWEACSADIRRELGLLAIRAQREKLEGMRTDDTIGADTYLLLQEELDWNELTILCDDERRIEEN